VVEFTEEMAAAIEDLTAKIAAMDQLSQDLKAVKDGGAAKATELETKLTEALEQLSKLGKKSEEKKTDSTATSEEKITDFNGIVKALEAAGALDVGDALYKKLPESERAKMLASPELMASFVEYAKTQKAVAPVVPKTLKAEAAKGGNVYEELFRRAVGKVRATPMTDRSVGEFADSDRKTDFQTPPNGGGSEAGSEQVEGEVPCIE